MLAIDTGFSSVKVRTEEKEFQFVTAIAPRPISAVALDGNDGSVVYGGKRYFVGEAARLREDRLYCRSVDFLVEHVPLLVAHAAQEGGAEATGPMVVGLPLANYRDKKGELTAKLSQFWCNGAQYSFRPLIVPQGVGALAEYLATADPRQGESGYVLDIGSNTVIMLRYADRKAIADGSRQFDQMGISRLQEQLGEHIAGIFRVRLDPTELNEAFLRGSVKLHGRLHDLTHVITEIVETYCTSLLLRIENEVGRSLDRSDRLVLAGGGAYHLKNRLGKYEGISHVLEKPEFANVRGYYRIGGAQ